MLPHPLQDCPIHSIPKVSMAAVHRSWCSARQQKAHRPPYLQSNRDHDARQDRRLLPPKDHRPTHLAKQRVLLLHAFVEPGVAPLHRDLQRSSSCIQDVRIRTSHAQAPALLVHGQLRRPYLGPQATKRLTRTRRGLTSRRLHSRRPVPLPSRPIACCGDTALSPGH